MTRAQLIDAIFSRQTYLCVGLDTDPAKLPKHLRQQPGGVFEFNRQIIDATKKHCIGYKINTAFYEAQGIKGWEAMEQTVAYIPDTHFKIADAKRGDIGNTSAQYARAFFETIPFDAITVAPYMGADSIRPFLEYDNKWAIVLGLTSNTGAADFEWQPLASTNENRTGVNGFLYESVISKVAEWGTKDNLMFVVGATQGDAFARIRALVPDHFFLVPGVGTQGGSLKDISSHAMTAECGLLVNVSRAVIYASVGEDFASEAGEISRQYHFQMKQYLEKKRD